MDTVKSEQIVNEILDHYEISTEDQKKLWEIIKPIWSHPEFQRRLDSEQFPHHDTISLGEHIISDTVVTFLLAQKKKWDSHTTKTAMTIALFHDLYELPWQNTGIKKDRFVNLHGFTHPLEGVVNAATWYPEYFNDDYESEIIVDGIVHHMFPFPVRSMDKTDTELNTKDKIHYIPKYIKGLMVASSTRCQIGPLSICPSKFPEGKIMSRADKIVSFSKDLKSINGLTACVTGHNKNLEGHSYTKKKELKFNLALFLIYFCTTWKIFCNR